METIKHFRPSADSSILHMSDVGEKAVTRRRAVAQGKIRLSVESFAAVRDGKNPKGDVLAVAEVAGLTTAKKTSELIPLCHPLPLDQVRLSFEFDESQLEIIATCEVLTHAKTGVEMEALSGVSGALLTIYDLCKAVDPVLTISEIRLNQKEGGKRGVWTHPDYLSSNATAPAGIAQTLNGIRAGVVTVSDRVWRREAEDLSGPYIRTFLRDRGAEVSEIRVVSDDKIEIIQAIRSAVRDGQNRLVVTTGGTGLGPRDVTPEALAEISDRWIPGFGELLRSKGARFTGMSWLSRSGAALVEGALVVILPGSRNACAEGLAALESLLPHALHTMGGGKHG